MEVFNVWFESFLLWSVATVYKWDLWIILVFATIGFYDAKKEFERSLKSWHVAGGESNISTQDFTAGTLVCTLYELKKIKVVLEGVTDSV